MKSLFRRMLPWLLMLVTVLALAEDEKIRLAVMGVEDNTGLFKPKALEAATDLLRTLLTKSEKFIIIDKGQQENELRKMYAAQKKETYKECYAQSCQIELGQALSADTLLRTQISKLGKVCTLNSEMIDLQKEAGVKSGSSEFDCTEDGLVDAIKDVAFQLTGTKKAKPGAVRPSGPAVSAGTYDEEEGGGGPVARKTKVTSATAQLTIKALPEEAVITVSGPKGFKDSAQGKFQREDLKPGSYTVKVEAAGYETQEKSYTLEPDDVKGDKVTLLRLGVLEIVGQPEKAKVEIEGPGGFKQTVGVPTTIRDAARGTYRLKVSKKGYEGEEYTAEVVAGSTATVQVNLKKPGNLEISGSPEGSKVEVVGPNGFKDEGGLPYALEGAYRGEYQIKVSREGYGTVEKRATVKPGETARVEVKLQKGASAGEVTKGDYGIEWVSIPGGTFEMGCSQGDTECESDEKPRHTVTVRGFRMMKYEVTQGQYRKVMGENPSRFTNCGETCPVEQVDWNQSKAFCEKVGGRLPTEEEWEYAARGGTKTKYYCGNDSGCLGAIAWYDGNSGNTTHPVGQKRANAFGLFDMSGNVWEWTGSCYSSDYNSSQDCSRRVIRGGSWGVDARTGRSSIRLRRGPTGRYDFVGLRCGRD